MTFEKALVALLPAALVAALAPMPPAAAAPGDVFSVSATGVPTEQSSDPISRSGTITGTNATADYTVAAGGGVARASLSGSFTGTGGQTLGFAPNVVADATTRVTVDGPFVPGGALFRTINVHVDGTIEHSCPAAWVSCTTGLEIVGHSLLASFSSGTGGDVLSANFPGLSADPIPGATCDAGHQCSAFHVHGTVAADIVIPIGTPFDVRLRLSLLPSSFSDGTGGTATFEADFANSVSFAPTGPVFDLPADYTANGSGLVDNQWQDPFAPVSPDVIIDLLTSQAFLDALNEVPGSLLMVNVDGRDFLIIPNLASIGVDTTITGNDDLLVVDLGALASVGGNIDISGNLVMTTIDLLSLTDVGGSVSVTDNNAAGSVDLSSLASVGDDFSVTDNNAAGSVDLSSLASVGDDFSVSGNDAAGSVDLPSLTDVGGSVSVTDNDAAGSVDLSSLASVGDDFSVSGNDAAGSVDVSSLGSVGGDFSVSGNDAAGTVDASSLTDVAEDLTITGNPSVTVLRISGVTFVGGDLSLIGTAATSIDLPALTEVGGSVSVTENGAATTIDVGSLASAGGSVSVTDNGAATTIDVGSLASAGGSVSVTDNGAATTIDLPDLQSAGGSVSVTENGAATTIDLPSLTEAGGGVSVTDNGAATTIDVGSLASVDGSISVTDNGAATTIDAGSLTDVSGDLTVETTGEGTFTPGPVSPDGDTNLETEGYTTVSGTTAAGSTTVESAHAEAIMRAQIPGAAFVTPTAFEMTRIAPGALPPEEGAAANGTAAMVDPVAAYEFVFGVPTLDRDATLTFEILLDGLEPAARDAFLAALDAGTATLATRGDTAGAIYQAFPLCAIPEIPSADGCVAVEPLDANGNPTTGTPTSVRFTGVVGHFSTWAVAIVEEIPPTEPSIAEAIERLGSLRQSVLSSSLHDALKTDLANKLRRAIVKLQENPPQFAAACFSLSEFIAKVDEKGSNPLSRLDRATADAWIAEARRIGLLAGCLFLG